MRQGLVELAARDRAGAEDVARLHEQLLPTSPIVRLGPRFTRRFYYHSLVADGLIACAIAYADDAPAGFIVCTRTPARFMAEGLRRHVAGLSAVLLGEIVSDPRRLKVIWWTLTHMRRNPAAATAAGPDKKDDEAEGEVLSFGVLPEFRNPAWIGRTGRRISLELFGWARGYFRSARVPRFRAVVESSNREALFFYSGQGCRPKPGAAAGPAGTTVVICEDADAP
jgi:ribosomal protein S18 acetylase RimI-like enzyme